jgi:transcriptional regulator with XRE-family HTH domain
MGTRRRERPQRLAEKLLTIRKTLGLNQFELAQGIELIKGTARVSEYEHAVREPDLIILLRYARLAGVRMEMLVDDGLDLIMPEHRKRGR